MPSSLDALALRPATTIASRPRLDATLRLGRRLPRRGLHAPRPRVEHDHAAGAGDRLLDRGDTLVPRRPTGPRPPRRWPRVRGEPAHAAPRPSRSKGRPRRRRAPTAAAQGPRRAARSALGSMQPVRGRSRPDHGRGLRRGRCGRPRRGSGWPARCPQRSAASAGSCPPGGWQPRQERSKGRRATPRARLDLPARPVPATWSPSPFDPGSVSAATSRGSRSDAPLSASIRSASRTGTGLRLTTSRSPAAKAGFACARTTSVTPSASIVRSIQPRRSSRSPLSTCAPTAATHVARGPISGSV